jgi:hypothetical protein
MQPLIICITTNCLITLAALVVALGLLRRKLVEAKILGLIWLLGGLIFLTNVMPDIFWAVNKLTYGRCVAIITITQLTIILFGLAIHFYTFFILFGSRKKYYYLIIFFLVLYIFYAYYTLTGPWGKIIYTPWGIEIAPPYLSLIFLLIIILIGLVPIFYIIFREIYRKIKKLAYNPDRLLGMLSITAYFIFGALDDFAFYSGPPLVFIRMIVLIGVLIAFFSYRETKNNYVATTKDLNNQGYSAGTTAKR